MLNKQPEFPYESLEAFHELKQVHRRGQKNNAHKGGGAAAAAVAAPAAIGAVGFTAAKLAANSCAASVITCDAIAAGSGVADLQTNPNEELHRIQASYSEVVATAENVGINQGIFDTAITIAQPLERATDEDEQVRQLVAQKGAFSASALWNVCGSRVGNARVVLRAQREQMAIDEAKSSLVEQNRLSRHSKLLANAQQALAKYRLGQSPLTDKDWGDIVRWVLPEAKVPGLMRELKKKDAIIAKLATLERDWTTYIPDSTPV